MTLESIQLTESQSGATARILPAMGFNCYSFVAAPEGRPVEVLWADPQFTTGTTRPAASGIPLLFPFAGRIRGTSFRYQGHEYPLEIGDALGNAIHGFVLKRPWRVIERSPSRAVGQFQASVDDRSLLASWPADFRITVAYELRGHSLVSEITVENPDDRPLPFALGTHGYFRVPLGSGGKAADCIVTASVNTSWELVGLRPTGRELPTELAPLLQKGMVIGETKLDHIFGKLEFAGGSCNCSVSDPSSGRRTTLSFGNEFRHCVIFNPPHREAICIEPYTTLPDPFSLLELGVDPGLRILQSGDSFRTEIKIQAE